MQKIQTMPPLIRDAEAVSGGYWVWGNTPALILLSD